MKKVLQLLSLLLCVGSAAIAQTPTYVTTAGTTNNSFPWGAAAGGNSKTQFLYTPAQFTSILPTGQITKIWFRPYSGSSPAGGNYGNFTIKMGMTSLATLTTTYVTGLQTGYAANPYVFPATAALQWFSITLQSPIPYTSGNNLLLEIEHSGYTGAAWYANCIAPTYNSRLYGLYQATTGTTSTGSALEIGLEIQTGPPCPVPSGLNATNILSTTATVGWNPAASSTGYEYIVDQNAVVPYPNTPTPTAGTSANVTGLLPGTNYYLHVHNMCSPTNPSVWVDYMFTTLPPCNDPSGFKTTNLQPTSTTINWDPLLSALSWDYIVDQDRNDPISSTGATNVTSPTDNITGLTEDTWYYVHIRANCTGEQSNWSLDSFQTPIPCRAPDLKISNVSVDEAVVYWEAVKTAIEYEYSITTSPNPPAIGGTRYLYTSLHMPALVDGKNYYIHVRCKCNSLGVISFSPWSTTSFMTWPTTVQNVNSSDFDIDAYPNPATDVLTIEVKGSLANNATITLSDVAGRVLRSEAITDAKTTLNIANLPAGNYMLKYADGANNRILKINKK
jgi:hypothetical protein